MVAGWKREDIYKRDEFRCAYCGFDGSSFEGWLFLEVDHLRPQSKGGTDEPENLVTACKACNAMKGADVYADCDSAKAGVEKHRQATRDYWEKNIRHLAPQKVN